MRAARRLLGVVALGVVASVAALLFARRLDPVPDPMGGRAGVAVGTQVELVPESARPIAEEPPRRQVDAARRVAWRVVDDLGAPVADARATTPDGVIRGDEDGRGSATCDAEHLHVRVEAPDHSPWDGDLHVGEDNAVVLMRVGGLSVRVIDDEDGSPVGGAEIWVGKRWTDGTAYDVDPTVLKAKSDRGGQATITGIPAGKYCVEVRHETLVPSYQRHGYYGSIVDIAVGTQNVTLQLSMPYVAGLEVTGCDTFSDSFLGKGTGYHSPSNVDGQWACGRIRTNLEKRFPRARFLVMVRDASPPSLRYGPFVATLWVSGRKPLVKSLELVPYAGFTGPDMVSCDSLPLSDAFGSLRITVKGQRDLPADMFRFSLETPFARWDKDGVMKQMFVRSGELVAVPVGTYDLRCEGVIESRVPFLHRTDIEVAMGAVNEVVLDCPVRWSRCRLLASPDSGGADMLGGGIVLEYRAVQIRTVELVDSFATPVECWLPDGELSMVVDAHARDRDYAWHGVLDAVAVHGGTLDRPQVLACTMSRARRP